MVILFTNNLITEASVRKLNLLIPSSTRNNRRDTWDLSGIRNRVSETQAMAQVSLLYFQNTIEGSISIFK